MCQNGLCQWCQISRVDFRRLLDVTVQPADDSKPARSGGQHLMRNDIALEDDKCASFRCDVHMAALTAKVKHPQLTTIAGPPGFVEIEEE